MFRGVKKQATKSFSVADAKQVSADQLKHVRGGGKVIGVTKWPN